MFTEHVMNRLVSVCSPPIELLVGGWGGAEQLLFTKL